MSENVTHHGWEFPDDDDAGAWFDTGPDVPQASLGGATSDLTRYAVSAPRIPRQRSGGNQPLRVSARVADTTELTFTQLIPAQYRPTDLRVTHAGLGDLAVVPVAPLVLTVAPDESTHARRLLRRGPAAVARAAARAFRGVRRAA